MLRSLLLPVPIFPPMLRSLLRKHAPHSTLTLHQPIPKPPDQPTAATTVSYLITSCGLSLSAALSAAKKIQLKSSANPNAVLALLREYGFTNLHIANLVSKCPAVLVSRPALTIKPKLEFFTGIGYADTHLAKLISSDPNLLLTSLEKRIAPNFEVLKTLLGSPAAAVAAVAHSSRLLRNNLNTVFLPNVETLRHHGVPELKMVKWVT